ncbi:hypothetical protein M885DRAFT_580223 [Pelagophyceae sp. CCMP2097]|nr:hypothetical protein M885DRAFT_580223 [Pelagophyceae sp. CCMP2097]
MDDLRPIESLPFFQDQNQAQNLAAAQQPRANMRARPLWRWDRPRRDGKTIKVFANGPSWLAPANGTLHNCPVPCAYAESAEAADATLQNTRVLAGGANASIHGVLSYEPGRGVDFDGSTVMLSFSRHADVVYEYFRRSDMKWDERPVPRRPKSRRPGSVVFVSNCGEWRIDYLKALAAHGVDVKFAGTCDKNHVVQRGVPNCPRRMAFDDCKIQALRAQPFAITFENSLLDDYVSEKWGHMWISGMIPVYWGSPLIYERAMEYPPFINIHDFAGQVAEPRPASLAAYLHHVVQNDTVTVWAHYTARGPLSPQRYKEGKRWGGGGLDGHVCDVRMAAQSSVRSQPWWS